VRHKELRQIFFLAFLIPYLIILFSGFFVIKKSYDNLHLVYDLKQLIYPLKTLSNLIFYLNEDKVLKIWETFIGKELEIPEKESVLSEIFALQKHLNENKKWQKYCNCYDILNLYQKLVNIRNKQYSSVKDLLIAYDNLILKLCNYYSALSSKLKFKELSMELNTLYTLHKFWTAISDFSGEKLVYLNKPYRGFYYSSYYYRGELVAYADTFYTLTDEQKFKQIFKQEIYNSSFIRILNGNVQTPDEHFLKLFLKFRKKFQKFHQKIFEHFMEKIDHSERIYKSNLIFTILGETLLLISLGVLNFLLYLYGQSKYEKTLSKLERKTFRDPLTGLLNRRFFNFFMLKVLKDKYLEGEPVSLILFDLDHFKKINDTYGHTFGDKVLKHIALLVRKHIRKNDIAIRWGGEEFAIFVNGPLDIAVKLAERLRRIIENSPVNGVKITASFGVGEFKGGDPKEFFKKVDEALYRAKQKGRNRVEVVKD
jgi:diguanylate cyclase (GGDEF)-like protein